MAQLACLCGKVYKRAMATKLQLIYMFPPSLILEVEISYKYGLYPGKVDGILLLERTHVYDRDYINSARHIYCGIMCALNGMSATHTVARIVIKVGHIRGANKCPRVVGKLRRETLEGQSSEQA